MKNNVDPSLSIPQPGDRIVWIHGYGKPGHGKLYDKIAVVSEDGIPFCKCHWDGDASTDPTNGGYGDHLPLTMCVREDEITEELLEYQRKRRADIIEKTSRMFGRDK